MRILPELGSSARQVADEIAGLVLVNLRVRATLRL